MSFLSFCRYIFLSLSGSFLLILTVQARGGSDRSVDVGIVGRARAGRRARRRPAVGVGFSNIFLYTCCTSKAWWRLNEWIGWIRWMNLSVYLFIQLIIVSIHHVYVYYWSQGVACRITGYFCILLHFSKLIPFWFGWLSLLYFYIVVHLYIYLFIFSIFYGCRSTVRRLLRMAGRLFWAWLYAVGCGRSLNILINVQATDRAVVWKEFPSILYILWLQLVMWYDGRWSMICILCNTFFSTATT